MLHPPSIHAGRGLRDGNDVCMDEHATDSVTSALGSSGNIPVSGSGLELNKSEHSIHEATSKAMHETTAVHEPGDHPACGCFGMWRLEDWDWKTALESLLYPNYSTMKQPYIKNSQTACSVGV